MPCKKMTPMVVIWRRFLVLVALIGVGTVVGAIYVDPWILAALPAPVFAFILIYRDRGHVVELDESCRRLGMLK